MNLIKTELKKTMLSNFCLNYALKEPDSRTVINYLHGNEDLLEHARFVDNASEHKVHLIISSVGVEGPSLTFVWNENTPQYSASDILSSFRLLDFLAKPVELYIQLNFEGKERDMLYQTVGEGLIENPKKNQNFNFENVRIAEEIIAHSLSSYELNSVLSQIDDALDSKDEKRFIELTKTLKDITMNSTSGH